ncbi:unnamed protein product [Microthlaspi erraticum]|uniref:Transposase MuDR plant domain-containing protein n=1 Tax=Microthlaspi erraticum TaxID=1685480 RepID=A0A6D2L7I3_9BRAS|nr:unnamed protein product [Microthlaspi erraticum]
MVEMEGSQALGLTLFCLQVHYGLFVAKCVVNGCAWKLRAAVKNEPDCFWVTKYVKGHTCSIMDRVAHRRRATPRYIGQLFVERTGLIDGIVPRQIADSMRIMFG